MMTTQYTASEDFRKYLISLIISGETLLTIWGTDLENKEVDKLIEDSNGRIIFSTDFEKLREYLFRHPQILFDQENFLKWLEKNNQPVLYASYNLDRIEDLIDQGNVSLSEDNEDIFVEVVDFLNLVSDVAHQNKDEALFKILKDSNIEMFKDYVLPESNNVHFLAS